MGFSLVRQESQSLPHRAVATVSEIMCLKDLSTVSRHPSFSDEIGHVQGAMAVDRTPWFSHGSIYFLFYYI